MATKAEVAVLPPPPSASGAGRCTCDLLAVSKAENGLQRDRGALFRGLLPPDLQELWLWLHRFKPAAHHCWA
jgi:hypothetical protein